MSKLPAGWVTKSLDEITKVVSGATPKTGKSEYWNGSIPWVTPDDLSRDRNKYIRGGRRAITQQGYDSCSTRLFPAGSVIVSSRAPIGYVAIAEVDMCTNQGCKTLLPSDFVTPDYLYWYMRFATNDLRSRGSGTTFLEVSAKEVGRTLISFPPVEEQRHIIKMLEEQFNRLEAGIKRLENVLSLTKTASVSLLANEFERAHKYDSIPFELLGKWVTGATPPMKDPNNLGTDVPFVTPGDVNHGDEINQVSRYISSTGADKVRRLPPNSVQLVCIGTLGKVGWSAQSITTNQQINSLVPDPLVADAKYIALYLSAPQIQSMLWGASSSTTVPILNKGRLEKLRAPFPPIDEQIDFVSKYAVIKNSLNDTESTIKAAITSGDLLKRSLLSNAFSGQLIREHTNVR